MKSLAKSPKLTFLLDHIGLSLATTALFLFTLSLTETIFIFPPLHSYNIGPLFFWMLLISPGYFLYIFIVSVVGSFIWNNIFKTNHKYKKFIHLACFFVSIFSVAISINWLIMLYRGYSIHIPTDLLIVKILENGKVVSISPLIITSFIKEKLTNNFKVKSWQFTLFTLLLCLLSVIVWWYFMGTWKIGL